jgi:hypothetical protein
VLYSLIKRLRQTVNPQNIVYLNFEDDRLFPLETHDLSLLLESYYELYPDKKNEKVYFFFDEIQNAPAWETFIRRLSDTENCAIFLTGSSAKLLSREIATSLRGRTITYEIFPLSFKEFLSFKKIPANLHSSRSLAKIRNALNEYSWKGGFPEVVHEKSPLFTKILQEYVELVMYRDVVERHKISHVFLLKFLQKYCLVNSATLISANNLFHIFKSEGFPVSKNTVYDYLSYFEDAYLLFSLPIHSRSVKAEMRNPKKIYSVDIGFKTVMDSTLHADLGRVYENIVFLHLRRQTTQLSYVKLKQEVDFYYLDHGQKQLLNVCVDLGNPQTRQRELSGLKEAMDYFQLKESWLITADHEETIRMNGSRIRIIPLWKWLLR